ncbi:MAG: heme exporter protein CcmD [Parvularculaceae bacterium]
MSDFLSMGGYGGFVWPAYLVSAVTLFGLAGFILLRAARARQRLAELEKREAAKRDG